MKTTSRKPWNNRTMKVLRNSIFRKSFAIFVVIFVLMGALLVFSNSPDDPAGIGARGVSLFCCTYGNGTYHISFFGYTSNGIPENEIKNFTLEPDTLSVKYPYTNTTVHLSMQIHNGVGRLSYKSKYAWIGPRGSIVPNNNESVFRGFMEYTPVYQKGFQYKGNLELVYISPYLSKSPYMDYRLLESNGNIINFGRLGNFTHIVLPLSYPPNTDTNIYGLLQWKINNTWTSNGLSSQESHGFASSAHIYDSNNVNEPLCYPAHLYAIPNTGYLTKSVFGEYESASIFFGIFMIILTIIAFAIPNYNGKSEFYMSLPVKRSEYYTGKYIAVFIGLLIAVITSIFISYEFLYFLNGWHMVFYRIMELMLIFTLLGMVSMSIAFMTTAFTKSMVKAIASPFLILIFLFYLFEGILSLIGGNQNRIYNLTLMDPLSAFKTYISTNLIRLNIGGQAIPTYDLPLWKLIASTVPWIIIPAVAGMILWKRRK